MKRIRKILQKSVKLSLLTGSLIFLIQSGVHAVENKSAEIVFDSTPVLKNISRWTTAEDSSIAEFTEKGGKTGLVRGTGSRHYIALNISDSYWYSDVGESVKVTVEYFDEGTGKFTLRYNSKENGRWASADDIVTLTNSGEWKTHTFSIDDILLNNYLIYGGDLEVALWSETMGGSDSDIVFKSVRIDEAFPKTPVASVMKTGKLANVFGRDEAVTFSVESTNITDYSLNSQIDCTVYGSDGKVVKSTTFTSALAADEKKTTQITLYDAKYDLYTVSVKVKSQGVIDGETKNFESVETFEISKVYTSLDGEAKNDYFNMCTHLKGKDLDVNAILLSKIGVGAVRDEYYWSEAETVKGEVVLSDSYKSRISTLAENGIDTLQILAYNNPLYSGSSSITQAPTKTEEINGFANYAGTMARELKGIVNKFEIWNEWNHASFNDNDAGAKDYVNVLKAAYNAIKAENPEATVYGVASASADNTFLLKILLYGGYNYMDAISIHPYDWDGDFTYSDLIDNVNKMKRTLSYYGDKPIVFSEMGWNTGENTSGVTEAEQARYVVQMTAISKAYDLADEIYWYDFQDDARDNEANSNFGSVNHQYSANPYGAKLSYLTISAMNRFMAGEIEYCAKIENSDRTTMMYSFDRTLQGDNLGILWSNEEGGKKVGMKLGCDNIKVYDSFGNLVKEESKKSGYYELDLSADPIYVTGSFTSFEESEKPASIESFQSSYDANKNIITVSGTAEVYDSFTLEFVKNNEVIKTETVNVKPDGSFYKIMTAPADGQYQLCAARVEALADGTDAYAQTNLTVACNWGFVRDAVSLTSSVTADSYSRNITVTGTLSNFEDGDLASIIVVDEGCTDINKETILYLGDMQVQDDTFTHTFKMLEGLFGKYDVYVSGNFLNKANVTDIGYGIAKVTSLNLGLSDNTYKVVANIKNNNTKDMPAVLFVAQYDESGRLIALEKQDITIPADTQATEEFSLSVAKDSKAVSCKAYIWDCVEKMYPLY